AHRERQALRRDARIAQQIEHDVRLLEQIGDPGALAAPIVAAQPAEGVPARRGVPLAGGWREVEAEQRPRVAEVERGLGAPRRELSELADLLLYDVATDLSLRGELNLLHDQTVEGTLPGHASPPGPPLRGPDPSIGTR